MTTTQTSANTFRNAILAGAATFAALAGVNSANALPITPIPINFPPVASFTATPNPVAVGDNTDRKSTRLNSSHLRLSRMPSSA